MKYILLLMLLGMLLAGQAFADSIFFLNNPQFVYASSNGGVMIGENRSTIGHLGGFKLDFFEVNGANGFFEAQFYLPNKFDVFIEGSLADVVFHAKADTITGLFTGWDQTFNYRTGVTSNNFLQNAIFSEHWNNGNMTLRTKTGGTGTASEPGAVVLMITGLASLAAMGRKKIAALAQSSAS